MPGSESIAPNILQRRIICRGDGFIASKQIPARPSALPPAYPCHPRRRMVSTNGNQWSAASCAAAASLMRSLPAKTVRPARPSCGERSLYRPLLSPNQTGSDHKGDPAFAPFGKIGAFRQNPVAHRAHCWYARCLTVDLDQGNCCRTHRSE